MSVFVGLLVLCSRNSVRMSLKSIKATYLLTYLLIVKPKCGTKVSGKKDRQIVTALFLAYSSKWYLLCSPLEF